MTRKLVDPIHFFDERGRALLSYEQLEKEIARKDEEIDKLRKMLKSMVQRYELKSTPKPANH